MNVRLWARALLWTAGAAAVAYLWLQPSRPQVAQNAALPTRSLHAAVARVGSPRPTPAPTPTPPLQPAPAPAPAPD